MSELSQKKCDACRVGAPGITDDEVREYMPLIPEWRMIEVDGVTCLRREFQFSDFRQALEFTNQVGNLAEDEGHHPAILTEWGNVTVSWWTHKIKGLHLNDFVMAAKTDLLVAHISHKGHNN